MSSFPDSGSVPSSVLSSSGNTTENDRKRRDNINDKIQELLAIIPSDFFQDYYKRKDSAEADILGSTPNAVAMGLKVKGTGTKDGRPNKGQILTQAVEYITHLQGQVDTRNREEVELILKVKELSKEVGVIVNDINLENTSAEVALARIGVGPLAGTVDDYYGENEQKNNNFEYGGYDEYGDAERNI